MNVEDRLPRLFSQVPERPLPPGFSDRIVAQLTPRSSARRGSVQRVLPVAASIALFAVVVLALPRLVPDGGGSAPQSPVAPATESPTATVMASAAPTDSATATTAAGPSTTASPRPTASPLPTATERPATPSPTSPGPASASPSSAAKWGPLAVVPPPDGADTALTEGTIRISDECVILEARRGPVLLIWPADRTTWDAAAKAVAFDNYESSGDPESGKTVTVTDGMRVALGGSGGTRDDGETPEEWLADREWVMRPAASCVVDEWWSVGAMTR